MPDAIPGDDILEVYIGQPDMTKAAVTNLMLSSENYVAVSFGGTTPNGAPMVNIDWTANPSLAIMLLQAAALHGKEQFGVTWLNTLIQTLIHRSQPN